MTSTCQSLHSLTKCTYSAGDARAPQCRVSRGRAGRDEVLGTEPPLPGCCSPWPETRRLPKKGGLKPNDSNANSRPWLSPVGMEMLCCIPGSPEASGTRPWDALMLGCRAPGSGNHLNLSSVSHLEQLYHVPLCPGGK